jgi:hypothetical protein
MFDRKSDYENNILSGVFDNYFVTEEVKEFLFGQIRMERYLRKKREVLEEKEKSSASVTTSPTL